MPLPRYQPIRKKLRVSGPSLDDLDDNCLTRIISHALMLSRSREEEPFVGDNEKTERNLSLVSKRWYFLTQTLVSTYGVHEINLPNIRPSASYDIKLFRAVQPKLLKYKHIQIKGSLVGDNFIKLAMALDSARIERLDLLNMKVENVRQQLKSKLTRIPKQLPHLQVLTLTWSNSVKDDCSNELIWSIYERACGLRELRMYLVDDKANGISANEMSRTRGPIQSSFVEMLYVLAKNSNNHQYTHPYLTKIVFKRSASPSNDQFSTNCDYSRLIKHVLSKERSIYQVDTNDSAIIEHLIKSSDRLCTRRDLSSLTLSAPIKSLDLLSQLIKLQNLGTDYLSIVIDNIDLIGDVSSVIENFKLNRHKCARCQLNLYLKDQKVPDCEDKVKNLTHISRLADVIVYINALQRISIDCCHLMWSTGRALQATPSLAGKCIFKITLQTYPIKPNVVNPCEITIPFGKCSQYKINPMREDITRHREILKSLKRDCYHQFVKSVRDNITS